MNKLTIREWLAFRIQTRQREAHTLLRSRRLFQQFLVDGFTMMESQRLNYIGKHKKNYEYPNTPICQENTNNLQMKEPTKAKEWCCRQHTLEVADTWNNYTLMEWQFVVKLDFPIYSLPLLAIHVGQRFRGYLTT